VIGTVADSQETTFRQWVGEYQGLVLKVVRAYAPVEDQDDLFQEICLQIWSSIPRFDGRAKTSTWIYRVALNTALVWKRGKKRWQRRRSSVIDLSQIADNRDTEAGIGRDTEIIERVYAAIRKLPKLDSSLILMYLDGLSYSGIAEILGISANNVGVKLNRARKKLAQSLGGLIDDV
jgi:RNA polymerase sigma-70 factor (ECF subfamily)